MLKDVVIGPISSLLGENGVPSIIIFLLVSGERSFVDICLGHVSIVVFQEGDGREGEGTENTKPDMKMLGSGSIESVLDKLSYSISYAEVGRRTAHELFVEAEVWGHAVIGERS